MNAASLHGVLKIVSLAVLALMALAMLYSGYIALTHWAGIGV